MKIMMLTSIAGRNFLARPGDIIERPDTVAVRLINRGHAEAVKGEKLERAVSKKTRKRETSRYKVVE